MAATAITTRSIILAAVALSAVLDPLAVASAPAGPTTTQNSTTFAYRPFKQPGIIGYWPNWGPYSRPQNSIDKIDLNGVSIVSYAFREFKNRLVPFPPPPPPNPHPQTILPDPNFFFFVSWGFLFISVNILANGTIASSDSWSDSTWVPTTLKVRNSYPDLLTSISVGGWSLSRYFSDVAANSTATAAFVKNIHAYIDANGFDGVDIDFEYPGGGGEPCNSVRAEDLENMITFFKALRTELGPDRLISFAVSVNAGRYIKNGVNYLTKYAPYLSYLGVMAFDMYTTSSAYPYSDIHTALNMPGTNDPQRPKSNLPNFSTASGIGQMLADGVPKEKLVLGVAFYGHSWSVASAGAQNGLFQACDKAGQNADNATVCAVRPGDYLDDVPSCDRCDPTQCAHTGVWMYFSLRGNNGTQRGAPLVAGPTTAGNGWTRGFAEWAATPTLYNPSFLPTNATGGNVTAAPYPVYITYDDPESIGIKTAWAKDMGLGGVFTWELSQDYQGELLSAMKDAWSC
ncbi:glycoside hydrolase superfamily [Zopfochytrium polystomum]|nr:glycoside hydrolase superfamily [Zopfochytrium polystomum]